MDRPRLAGVLNVTPDSFSDGGKFLDVGAAAAHAVRMADEGADLIDVGGESTRPGAGAVEPEEQMRRVLPVIERLRDQLPRHVGVSIDTTSAAVAAAALDAGAGMINDVSAGRDDPAMLALAVRRGAAVVLMHMQGRPSDMQQGPRYGDVVTEVRRFLIDRARAACEAGVDPRQIVIDPGFGFGKTPAHNLALLSQLKAFTAMEYAVMLGTSRKSTLRLVLAEQASASSEEGKASSDAVTTEGLDAATAATTAIGVVAGVKLFRVHAVAINRQAADTAWAIAQTGGSLSSN